MYTIRDYSCYDNYTVKSKTENVSNVVDKMIRITAKITESFASDIYYDILALYQAINKKEKLNRVLFFREGGVSAKNIPIEYCESDYIQTWHLTHDPETCTTVLKRVSIVERS